MLVLGTVFVGTGTVVGVLVGGSGVVGMAGLETEAAVTSGRGVGGTGMIGDRRRGGHGEQGDPLLLAGQRRVERSTRWSAKNEVDVDVDEDVVDSPV